MENNKSVTAIEWLESKFNEFETIYYSLPSGLYEYVNQAKEMENQQQGYSEEEVKNILRQFEILIHKGKSTYHEIPEWWFEQFNK